MKNKQCKMTGICLILSLILLSGCKKKVKPPDTPDIPTGGPAIGKFNVSYTYWSSAYNPEGDSVAIRFDWGDGDISNWSSWVEENILVSMSHSWSDSGEYNIMAQAKNMKDATSNWSDPCSILILYNLPPSWVEICGGPFYLEVNVLYAFRGYAYDPERDSVAIRFDWGDGDTSNWSRWGLGNGYEEIPVAHSWSDTGSYNMKAQAKDIHGAISNWSSIHKVFID